MGRQTRGRPGDSERPLPPPRVDWGGLRPGRRSPLLFHGLVGLALAAAGTVLLWWGLNGSWSWKPWAAAWLASINVTAFGYYAWDKVRSRSADGRVPELVLHFAPGYVYQYKGFTVPAHRGQRLHAIGKTRALRHYLSKGYRGLLSYVESTNFESLKSNDRMGYETFGSIYVVRLFGRYLAFSTPGCRRYQFRLEPAAGR